MNFERKQGSRALEDMEMLNFIDSLHEEPVSDTQPLVMFYGLAGSVGNTQEEPASEDLLDRTQTITYKGEVYNRCYKDELDAFACKYPMSVPKTSKKYAKYSDVDLTIAVKEGAKWQKAKDQSAIELAEDHAMLAGMAKMKEQMTAKAVVTTFNVSLPCGVYDKLEAKGCKEGDRLLVIKED